MHDSLPFELLAEDLLSAEDIQKINQMTDSLIGDLSSLSLDELRQSPIFREIECAMLRVVVVINSDYYALHRVVVLEGTIRIFSYYCYLGSHPEDAMNEMGVLALSPNCVHVIIPIAAASELFDIVINYDTSTALPVAGTLLCFDKHNAALNHFETADETLNEHIQNQLLHFAAHRAEEDFDQLGRGVTEPWLP